MRPPGWSRDFPLLGCLVFYKLQAPAPVPVQSCCRAPADEEEIGQDRAARHGATDSYGLWGSAATHSGSLTTLAPLPDSFSLLPSVNEDEATKTSKCELRPNISYAKSTSPSPLIAPTLAPLPLPVACSFVDSHPPRRHTEPNSLPGHGPRLPCRVGHWRCLHWTPGLHRLRARYGPRRHDGTAP